MPLWARNIKILKRKVKKKRDYILDKHKIARDNNLRYEHSFLNLLMTNSSAFPILETRQRLR